MEHRHLWDQGTFEDYDDSDGMIRGLKPVRGSKCIVCGEVYEGEVNAE